jgi:hypothetical protein
MTKSRSINQPKHLWTGAERDRLRLLYPDHPAKEVAKQMGLRLSQIYQMAGKLGLEKSEAFKAIDKSGRVARGRQHPSMIATRFQPGLQPWNKGTHYVAGGRSAETRFKKGRKPEESRNYLPIGSLRVCADGYLERKVTDDPKIVPARRWVAVHRQVWEAAHGPIPDRHVVVYKPGRKTVVLEEITLDAIECISRKELVRRNGIWSKDPELAKLYQLKGAITRQVNRIKESQNV